MLTVQIAITTYRRVCPVITHGLESGRDNCAFVKAAELGRYAQLTAYQSAHYRRTPDGRLTLSSREGSLRSTTRECSCY